MEKMKNRLDYLMKKKELERMRAELDFENRLRDKEFQTPRSYGHAKYQVVGGHGEWKEIRDAQKLYFFFRLDRTFAFLGNEIRYTEGDEPVMTVCLSVVRLGGYSGNSRLPSLQELIEETGLKYRS